MSFTVHPPALRTYAEQLGDVRRAAEAANGYVDQHGSFDLHEGGLFGIVVGGHRDLLTTLDQLLTHLADLTDASTKAMTNAAARYERADLRAEAATDAAYPAVPRPPVDRD